MIRSARFSHAIRMPVLTAAIALSALGIALTPKPVIAAG